MAQTPAETVPSVCPHDCTSTCALEVERLDLHTIGRVRGSHRNTYTRGVICEKVGRYAERVHHPDRLLHPLRRVGPKGAGRFERIGWDEALDLVAEAFTRQAARLGPRRCGRTTTRARWAWCSATASTGCATRWATRATLDDLRDPGRHRLGRRRRGQARSGPARDRGALGPGRDLGRQPGEHPGQRDESRHAGQAARRHLRGGGSLPHRHRGEGRSAPGPAAGHRRRARLRDHARALRGGPRRLGLPARLHRLPRRAGRPRGHPDAGVGGRHHRAAGGSDRGLRPSLRADEEELHPLPPRLQPLAQRRGEHARGELPARDHRRVAPQGRRRGLRPDRDLSARPHPDRGARPRGQDRSARSISPAWARSSPATATPSRAARR